MPSFDSDGVRIHYTDGGAGPPVVLVHGLTSNSETDKAHDAVALAHWRMARQFANRLRLNDVAHPERRWTEIGSRQLCAFEILDHGVNENSD